MPNKSLLIICLTVIVSLFIFSRTGIYIKSIAGVESNGRVSNSISVSGDGKVSAKPDMVQIHVSFQELGATSRQALDKVDQKIAAAIKVLKDNGIPDTDIQTDNLNVYTEYDYSNNYRRIIGQRASQGLSVKVKKIDDKATKAAKIIDELSSIDNLQMNGIVFDIEDKTRLFSQARELAFKKAQQKAEELAKLSGVKLLKPLSISDTTYDVSASPRYSNVAQMKIAASTGADMANSAEISTGEMSISSSLNILWSID